MSALHFTEVLLFLAGFSIITLASKEIGAFFTRFRLPLISGFLFAGMLAGPYLLRLLSAEAVINLRFVDQIALAFIALAAGSELYIKDLRTRLRSIKWVTFGLVTTTFILGSAATFFCSELIPFMRTMPITARLAVAILTGSILVARSPSSAIAVIHELRARGPFTQTALGVTVIMDVVVICLFAINSSISDALFTGMQVNLRFLVLVVAELMVSVIVGYLLGRILEAILALPIGSSWKAGLVLGAGYGIFTLSTVVRTFSHHHLPFELLLEPLLICMIAGFLVTNNGKSRMEFLKILRMIAPPIYIAFFTLTGASLALDVLTKTWMVAVILFAVRLLAIFIGSFWGGVAAGDPMPFNRLGWMAYVTQAGVGLGLAKQVAGNFPEWGASLATIIIAVIVLNQLLGPPLFKWVILHLKEAHSRADTRPFDGVRDAIIFGFDTQVISLSRQLRSHGWQVRIATCKPGQIPEAEESDLNLTLIPDLNLEALNQLEAGRAEAIITMLSDEENYRICELAYENFGTRKLIVLLHNHDNFTRFHELGALIVYPTTAIVGLLDHFVRSPLAASMLLSMDENEDMVEVEVRNPALDGVALRDLTLPLDTLILAISRDGRNLISHGYTCIEIGDSVTVMGNIQSIEEVMRQFEG